MEESIFDFVREQGKGTDNKDTKVSLKEDLLDIFLNAAQMQGTKKDDEKVDVTKETDWNYVNDTDQATPEDQKEASITKQELIKISFFRGLFG